MRPKLIHDFSFAAGLVFLLLAIYQALVLSYPHFYTSFALGSWLVLDFIDYRLNGYSILGYFSQHKHHKTFFWFLVVSTFFCFVVDYLWGVRVSGMWEWVNYKTIHFIRMYVVMNASFIMSMYELFRVLRSLIEKYTNIENKTIIDLRIHTGKKGHFYVYCLLIGMLGIIAPSYILILNTKMFVEYVMFLPFISMIFIADGITFLTGGKPILDSILHLKKLNVYSLLLTGISAALVTEFLNLFGNEWRYVRMPFQNIAVFDIPVAVFIGWIPLVIGSIAIINLIKHVDYFMNRRNHIIVNTTRL